MKNLNQIFFKGLIVVLPITLTFYLLIWASIYIESMFGNGLEWIIGKELYIPGLGIVMTIAFVMLVGVLVNNYITGRFFFLMNESQQKIPLIKVIYNPLKDLMGLIPGGRSAKDRPQRVVLIPAPGFGGFALGLVTREELDELPGSNLVSVYIPYSYMLGGFTVLVEKDKVQKVDMPVEQALKLGVTAWIKASEG